jgi:hypothetical protein
MEPWVSRRILYIYISIHYFLTSRFLIQELHLLCISIPTRRTNDCISARLWRTSPPTPVLLQCHPIHILFNYGINIPYFIPAPPFPCRFYSRWSRCVVTWMRPAPQPLRLLLPLTPPTMWFIASSFWSSLAMALAPGKYPRYLHLSPGNILHSY